MSNKAQQYIDAFIAQLAARNDQDETDKIIWPDVSTYYHLRDNQVVDIFPCHAWPKVDHQDGDSYLGFYNDLPMSDYGVDCVSDFRRRYFSYRVWCLDKVRKGNVSTRTQLEAIREYEPAYHIKADNILEIINRDLGAMSRDTRQPPKIDYVSRSLNIAEKHGHGAGSQVSALIADVIRAALTYYAPPEIREWRKAKHVQ
jgi:hypothetical protein